MAELVVETSGRLTTSGSESARLDAELLLGHVLGVDRSALAAHPEVVLSTGQLERFEAAVVRREAGEPVAYIRGLKEFYGSAIVVDRRVLIPRPETEALVDLAVERIRTDLTSAPRDPVRDPYLVWDIGTGSGAICVAIGSELRRRRYGEAVRYFASDLSGDARDVATINIVSHGLAHLVTFAEGDLTDVAPRPPYPVDLVLANLPYVPSGSIGGLPVAASFEPAAALDGGPDGLLIVRRLMEQLPGVVISRGVALLEIGADQADAATEAAIALLPGWRSSVQPDLSGGPRVLQLERCDA